jgi:hypothetical protein
MGEGGQKCPKLRDLIYGRPLDSFLSLKSSLLTLQDVQIQVDLVIFEK